MSLFLKKLFFFISLPLVMVIGTDIFLRQKNTLYKEKLHGLIQNKENIEIIILGNSQANYGVDPTAFELDAYNIANVNQSIYFDKRILLSQLSGLKNLKYVLISADYHSLYFSSQGIRDIWSYYDTGVRYKNNNYFLEDLSPTLFGYTPKIILSLYKKELFNILNSKNVVIDFPVQRGVDLNDSIEKGFIGFENTYFSTFNDKFYHKQSDEFNRVVKNSTERIEIEKDLRGLLFILKSKNINPILFTTPTFVDYNKYLDPQILRMNDSIFKEISKEYDIPYWNFMNSTSFKQTDFFDPNHLNKTGAHKFGKLLNDSLRKGEKLGAN